MEWELKYWIGLKTAECQQIINKLPMQGFCMILVFKLQIVVKHKSKDLILNNKIQLHPPPTTQLPAHTQTQITEY